MPALCVWNLGSYGALIWIETNVVPFTCMQVHVAESGTHKCQALSPGFRQHRPTKNLDDDDYFVDIFIVGTVKVCEPGRRKHPLSIAFLMN